MEAQVAFPTPEDRTFWLAVRQAILMLLDALERWLKIEPRTAELRKQKKKRP